MNALRGNAYRLLVIGAALAVWSLNAGLGTTAKYFQKLFSYPCHMKKPSVVDVSPEEGLNFWERLDVLNTSYQHKRKHQSDLYYKNPWREFQGFIYSSLEKVKNPTAWSVRNKWPVPSYRSPFDAVRYDTAHKLPRKSSYGVSGFVRS